MHRDTVNGAVMGGLAGLMLWLFDHSFFMSGGVPRSPISDALLRLLGVGSEEEIARFLGLGRDGGFLIYEYLLPLALLIIAGGTVGGLAARLLRR